MKLPYGNADFYRLVKEGEVYVDRTDRIRDLERMGNALLFLRPRRFGKSLLLRMLSCYYDLRYRDEHDDLFGALAVGDRPTELAHRYFVLEWDFSLVVPELSPGDVGALLNGYVNSEIRSFLSDYRDHLPGTLEMGEVAVENLTALLALICQTPHPLYLLVDEYDNFANEVMMSDPEAYEGLVKSEGPLRGLMKWIKTAMKGGLDRLLFTGVSPIVMSDVTTSLRITKNVSQHPLLADLCGFREDEVRRLSSELLRELAEAEVCLPDVANPGSNEAEDSVLDMMRDWYDGYRFAEAAREKIYNPTLVLYFLDHLQDYHAYPRQMLDSNLSMDTGKLEYVAREVSGQQAVVDVLQTGEPLVVDEIADGFSLTEMVRPKGHDPTSLGSFLYYFGMLTLQGWNDERELRLVPPNLVARSLYVDHVRKLLLAGEGDLKTPQELSRILRRDGEIEPLAAYVEQVVFRRFSNPDYRWMNELAVKTAFLALLFESASYTIDSEPELERGRADLCLLRRPDARKGGLWDLLIEFKYLKPGELKVTGGELQALSHDELFALDKVREAFAEAREQVLRYREDLKRCLGTVLRLRSYAVVALGFERLLVREYADHEILEEPGEGSNVGYRARDTRLDRDVALTFRYFDFNGSEELKERFIKEAKAVSVLDHPNICRIHSVEEADDGRLIVTMDNCQGVTIKEKLRAGPLPGEEVVKYAIQIATGLQAAHERGILHLDIKPSNLLVTSEGVVKILGFGFSGYASGIGPLMGTIRYMAPELLVGETAGPASDIWALGVVVYEMATGVKLFHGKNDMAVLYAIVHRDVGLEIERQPDLPVGLGKILRRALGKGRRHAYKSMGEILADLELLLQPREALPQEKRASRFRLRGRGWKWWG